MLSIPLSAAQQRFCVHLGVNMAIRLPSSIVTGMRRLPGSSSRMGTSKQARMFTVIELKATVTSLCAGISKNNASSMAGKKVPISSQTGGPYELTDCPLNS